MPRGKSSGHLEFKGAVWAGVGTEELSVVLKALQPNEHPGRGLGDRRGLGGQHRGLACRQVEAWQAVRVSPRQEHRPRFVSLVEARFHGLRKNILNCQFHFSCLSFPICKLEDAGSGLRLIFERMASGGGLSWPRAVSSCGPRQS